MIKKTALVVGALGVVGRAVIEQLHASEDWDVVSLSRRDGDFGPHVRHIRADLSDPKSLHAESRVLGSVTHVFYCAHFKGASPNEEIQPNLTMLSNLVEALEAAGGDLQHIQLIHGSKWYGNHLGPYRTPAREDDPRQLATVFYYDQQDWLQARQEGKRWTWSALRPHCICGFSVGSPMNHLMALALYATISRELGLPLRFPGNPAAFGALYEFTDARLLARAMKWVAVNPACSNQAFNLTNGAPDRWKNIWPDIAASFGMRAGECAPISLARTMADKEPLWTKMQAKYGLRPYAMKQLVDWGFADWAYSTPYDQVSSLTKIRQAGWCEVLDPAVMFRDLVAELAEKKIIPPAQ